MSVSVRSITRLSLVIATALSFTACANMQQGAAPSINNDTPSSSAEPAKLVASDYAQWCVRAGKKIECGGGGVVAINGNDFVCRPPIETFPYAIRPGEKACKGIQ